LPAPALFPMVRGRLVSINGKPVSASEYQDDRAKRLVEREFNLSWATKLQPDNQLVGGRWWDRAPGNNQRLLSVEQGIAQTLGIKINDVLTYSVAGDTFSARVANLRKVDWDSFKVNFFVIASPGSLEKYPVTYITSFYVPRSSEQVLGKFVQRFPNATVIDVAAIMEQVRAIMDRVAGAVEFVFLFTLAAGLTVLYAAIVATHDERMFEAALLRTLGASRRQVLLSILSEFALIGLIAGLVGAAGASGIGYMVGTRVLNLPISVNPALWLAGSAVGTLGVVLAGLLGMRRVLNTPPMRTLRTML
jgi:putative ABC transport system permease protein